MTDIVALMDQAKQNPQLIASFRESINKALYERALFERDKKPKASHVLLRRVGNAFADSNLAASFFASLDLDPHLVFNRERQAGKRANLEGLMKVRGLIDYIAGRNSTLDNGSLALFACSIIAAKKGVPWLSSAEQEKILTPEIVDSLPVKIQKAIRDYQNKGMTIEGRARPEASSFRTTFENIGIFEAGKESDDKDVFNVIAIDLSNPVIQYLNNKWFS